MFQHKIWEEGYQAVEFSSSDLWVLIIVYQNSLEDPGCVLVSPLHFVSSEASKARRILLTLPHKEDVWTI